MTDATPQAALLSDDEIERHFEINKSAPGRELRRLIGRSIEADVLAKLQATQAEPVQAGELPDEREAFERWWRQRQLLTFPKDYDQGRLDGWGSAYKPAAMEAWQAALAARKPLMDPQARLEAFEDLVEDLAEWSRSVIEDTAPETLEMHVRKVLKRHGINGLEVKT